MKTNLAMTNILGDIEKLLSLRKIGLEPELTSILSDGIVELDDCIFLRSTIWARSPHTNDGGVKK